MLGALIFSVVKLARGTPRSNKHRNGKIFFFFFFTILLYGFDIKLNVTKGLTAGCVINKIKESCISV